MDHFKFNPELYGKFEGAENSFVYLRDKNINLFIFYTDMMALFYPEFNNANRKQQVKYEYATRVYKWGNREVVLNCIITLLILNPF